MPNRLYIRNGTFGPAAFCAAVAIGLVLNAPDSRADDCPSFEKTFDQAFEQNMCLAKEAFVCETMEGFLQSLGYFLGRLKAPGLTRSERLDRCLKAHEKALLNRMQLPAQIPFMTGLEWGKSGKTPRDKVDASPDLDPALVLARLEANFPDEPKAGEKVPEAPAILDGVAADLVGRWEIVEVQFAGREAVRAGTPTYITFFPSGRFEMTLGAKVAIGQWSIRGEGQLTQVIDGVGSPFSSSLRFSVDKTRLTLVDAAGNRTEVVRRGDAE